MKTLLIASTESSETSERIETFSFHLIWMGAEKCLTQQTPRTHKQAGALPLSAPSISFAFAPFHGWSVCNSLLVGEKAILIIKLNVNILHIKHMKEMRPGTEHKRRYAIILWLYNLSLTAIYTKRRISFVEREFKRWVSIRKFIDSEIQATLAARKWSLVYADEMKI